MLLSQQLVDTRCVVCLCSAHLHRVELADPASPSALATCHDLYPFPILSHMCLLLPYMVPLSLPHFLRVLFLLFIPYCTVYFVLFHACGCASERWHRAQSPGLKRRFGRTPFSEARIPVLGPKGAPRRKVPQTPRRPRGGSHGRPVRGPVQPPGLAWEVWPDTIFEDQNPMF